MVRQLRSAALAIMVATGIWGCGDDGSNGPTGGTGGSGATGGSGGTGGTGATGGGGDPQPACANGTQDDGEDYVDCGGDCPVCVDSVVQHGITWTFDHGYRSGTFANGDPWVLGPVRIEAISPAFDGDSHGWEVNPVVSGDQGFDGSAGSFDPSLVPELPYQAVPSQSVVKSESLFPDSTDDCYPACLKAAAVLTVVGEVPPDDGASVFRPPYVAGDKPYYRIDQLRTELLGSLASVPSAPELSWVERKYERVQLEHKGGRTGRIIRPVDNYDLPDPYGAHVGRDAAAAALRLMLDDPVADKQRALIGYVQGGIDRYHALLDGQDWPSGGGFSPGMKLPLAFAAVLLGDEQMQADVMSAVLFTDDTMLFRGASDQPLFGWHEHWSEENYWEYLVNDPGYHLERADPYDYIDGGRPTDGYQECCLSQPWKAAALAARLLPEAMDTWNNDTLFDYVDRWVSSGTLTQPDPCAPHDGIWSNYGVTYGPDGNGGCILDTNPNDGVGRFPNMHGNAADGGGYRSEFADEMWAAYR